MCLPGQPHDKAIKKRKAQAFRFFQLGKEPMFLSGKSRGSVAFWGKNEQDLGKTGVLPTPICQLFQIHGSIFKPDPSRDCGQTSVVCISHRVLFFCIRKNPFNRLFALCINLFPALCFS